MIRFRSVLASSIVLSLAASASFGQAFINAGSTVATVEYRRNTLQVAADSTVFAVGNQWLAPNFLTTGLFVDADGAGNSNSGFTAVTYSFVTAPGGPLAPFAAAINIPQATFFTQNDPGNALPQASMIIDFQIDVVGVAAGLGGIGFQLTSLPGFYAMAFNIPVGSFGQFDAQINYTSLTTGLAVLPQQNMNFGGAGFNGAGVANMAFPGAGFSFLGAPSEIVRISGFIEFQVNNEGGPVTLTLTETPTPGAATLLALGSAFGARRSRRR